MTKSLLVAVLLAATLLSVGTFYIISHKSIEDIPSIPLDENNEKIKLGGIPWPFDNCGG